MDLDIFKNKVDNNEISIKEAHDVLSYYHRIYYKNWNPRSEGQGKRTQDWMKAGEIFNQLAKKIWDEFKGTGEFGLSYAYSPRESANSHGGCHIVAKKEYQDKRIKREPGDPLCKKRKKFWMLSPVNDEFPSCLVCLIRAEKSIKK